MSRYAAIDIGSNSVMLHVAERLADGSFQTLDTRLEITRLARGLEHSGRLSDVGMKQTTQVLAGYVDRARELQAERPIAVGTMALRTASDATGFIARVQREIGLRIEVLQGEEEARLSLLAIQDLYQPEQGALGMLDVGGGSTEVSLIDSTGPLSRDSINLGAVNATERFLPDDTASPDGLVPLACLVTSLLAPLRLQQPALLVGVGGTLTTLAAVQLGLTTYDAQRIEGAELTIDDLDCLQDRLGRLSLDERRQVPGMEPKRADIILGGLTIAGSVMRHMGSNVIRVSDRGLRHGLLIDRFGRTQSDSTR